MTFGSQVLRSVAWSGAGSIVLRVGQLLAGIVAARLLVPHDFGLFAITLAVYAVVVNFCELGVGSAIIRAQDDLDELGPTAVTMSMVSSAALAGLMFLLAPAVAAAFGGAEAANPIKVMALVVLLAGPSAVPAAVLTRAFRQDLRFRADLGHFVVANIVMIAMALEGFGAMALAWSRVAGQLVSVVILLLVTTRRFRPGFQFDKAKYLMHFGLPLVGANLIGFALGNVDVVALGRAEGPGPLGIYTLANNVSAWPLGFFVTLLLSVGLPVLARVRDQPLILASYMNNAMRMVGAMFFFSGAMLVALSGPLVEALYGERWHEAAPILAVLGVFGSVRGILALLSDALVACNATRRLMWINLIWIGTLTPAVIAGVMLGGTKGVAIANVLVAVGLVLPLALRLTAQVMDIKPAVLAVPLAKPLLGGILAAVAAFVVSGIPQNAWLALAAGGIAGTVTYGLVLHGWLRRVGSDARSLYATEPS